MEREIDVYLLKEFDRWLERLRDREGRLHILARIDRLVLGNFGDVKRLKGGISELKMGGRGPGYRIYFVERKGVLIILLVGGDKGTQGRDIEKARDLVKDHDIEDLLGMSMRYGR